MAGILPFSYEYALKDRELGVANLLRSWYALFKTHTLPLLLQGREEVSEADLLFMEMLQKIWDKRERRMTRNVGMVFRGRWMQRKRMVRGLPACTGFVGVEGEGGGQGENSIGRRMTMHFSTRHWSLLGDSKPARLQEVSAPDSTQTSS